MTDDEIQKLAESLATRESIRAARYELWEALEKMDRHERGMMCDKLLNQVITTRRTT